MDSYPSHSFGDSSFLFPVEELSLSDADAEAYGRRREAGAYRSKPLDIPILIGDEAEFRNLHVGKKEHKLTSLYLPPGSGALQSAAMAAAEAYSMLEAGAHEQQNELTQKLVELQQRVQQLKENLEKTNQSFKHIASLEGNQEGGEEGKETGAQQGDAGDYLTDRIDREIEASNDLEKDLADLVKKLIEEHNEIVKENKEKKEKYKESKDLVDQKRVDAHRKLQEKINAAIGAAGEYAFEDEELEAGDPGLGMSSSEDDDMMFGADDPFDLLGEPRCGKSKIIQYVDATASFEAVVNEDVPELLSESSVSASIEVSAAKRKRAKADDDEASAYEGDEGSWAPSSDFLSDEAGMPERAQLQASYIYGVPPLNTQYLVGSQPDEQQVPALLEQKEEDGEELRALTEVEEMFPITSSMLSSFEVPNLLQEPLKLYAIDLDAPTKEQYAIRRLNLDILTKAVEELQGIAKAFIKVFQGRLEKLDENFTPKSDDEFHGDKFEVQKDDTPKVKALKRKFLKRYLLLQTFIRVLKHEKRCMLNGAVDLLEAIKQSVQLTKAMIGVDKDLLELIEDKYLSKTSAGTESTVQDLTAEQIKGFTEELKALGVSEKAIQEKTDSVDNSKKVTVLANMLMSLYNGVNDANVTALNAMLESTLTGMGSDDDGSTDSALDGVENKDYILATLPSVLKSKDAYREFVARSHTDMTPSELYEYIYETRGSFRRAIEDIVKYAKYHDQDSTIEKMYNQYSEIYKTMCKQLRSLKFVRRGKLKQGIEFDDDDNIPTLEWHDGSKSTPKSTPKPKPNGKPNRKPNADDIFELY